uniref:Ig-like domain-containing protein n=1 Tax=Esox lucius TaxID=8010 RepID=A0AAY5L6E5_ESOLU
GNNSILFLLKLLHILLSQFFEYESVSLSCEVQGNSTGWRLERNTMKPSESGVESVSNNGSNYLINPLKPFDSGEYWCESDTGEYSNTVNITVHGGHVILESPPLPVTEGHSVTLNCRYKKTPSDLTADFYKDGSLIRTESTGVMTIPAVSQSDEGLYSWLRQCWKIMVTTQNNDTLGPILPFSLRAVLTFVASSLDINDCVLSYFEGTNPGSSYRIPSTKTSDSGLYWCQSWSGEHSKTVNITVHGGHVILESPALPVTEGHSVILNCRYKKGPSNLTADFYKNGSFIRTETNGGMTIPAVNKSDEGLYSCRHPELGRSPESWMTVTDVKSDPRDVTFESTDVTHEVRTKLDQESRRSRGRPTHRLTDEQTDRQNDTQTDRHITFTILVGTPSIIPLPNQ